MNENKTNINWYPGHMAKTKRQIKEKIDLIRKIGYNKHYNKYHPC